MKSNTTSKADKEPYDNQQLDDADISFGGYFEFDVSNLRVVLDITVNAVRGAAKTAAWLIGAFLAASVTLVVIIGSLLLKLRLD